MIARIALTAVLLALSPAVHADGIDGWWLDGLGARQREGDTQETKTKPNH